MTVCLVLSERHYALMELRQGEWVEFAVLNGGAAALLPPRRPVDEAGLEAAIEIAEDWLMPHARRLRGEVLEVRDATGRLKAGLNEVLSEPSSQWTPAEFESVFLQLLDKATGRTPPPALDGQEQFIADVLIMRELAHHADLRALQLA